MNLTEAQKADIEQRVDEGTYFLDHVMPSWAYRVDLSKLDLDALDEGDAPCGCIVMQVTDRRYVDGLLQLGNPDGWRLGFDGLGFFEDGCTYNGDAWFYAHELWQEAVLERRPNVLIGGERGAA